VERGYALLLPGGERKGQKVTKAWSSCVRRQLAARIQFLEKRKRNQLRERALGCRKEEKRVKREEGCIKKGGREFAATSNEVI